MTFLILESSLGKSLGLEIEQRIIEVIQDSMKEIGAPKSSAADILLSLVPIIGIIFGVTLLFFYFYWQYKQRQELIKQKQYIPQTYQKFRTLSLLVGCLGGSIGLPISILFLYMDGVSYALLGGLIPFATGIGLLLFYIFSRGK